MKLEPSRIILRIIFFLLFTSYNLSSQTITGELKQYHKTTITFNALDLSEASATYLNYRMNVTITAPSSATYVVPGYFAADGNAAETSATNGNKWRMHFTPKEIGTYTYRVSFRTGANVAVNLSPTAGIGTSIDGSTGSFTISATDKTGNDYRAKGKLEYIGTDTARFANGDYYFEVGADSPETFLQYDDFDATSFRHDFATTSGNNEAGDPTWQGGKGTEITSAINYLSSSGMNVHYFLTMNITGDGGGSYPFPNNSAYTTYDCSKLDQWQIVFDHMYNKGMVQEFVLTETENSNWFEDQEGVSSNNFSNSRKLYYREMIARFGYLNVFYDIGEEANWNVSGDQYSAAQIEEAAVYIQSLSPYNDLITVHNGPSNDFSLFPALTALAGTSALTSISMQGNYQDFGHGFTQLRNVKNLATADGTEWVVRYSEPYAGSLPDLETWTENSLWASISAGGVGIHYYSYNGDVTSDNYPAYASYYTRMRYAREFLENNSVPFWNMENNTSLVSNGYLLTDSTDNFVVFLPNGGTSTLDLPSGNYTVKWFDPRNGGSLQNGSINSLSSGTNVSVGSAPNSTSSSWVVYIKKENGVNTPVTGVTVTPENAQILVGATTQLNTSISPNNATNTAVTWSSSNNAIATVDNNGLVTGIAQGNVTITATTNDGGFTDTTAVTVSENTSNNCTADYEEINNIVVIEAENIDNKSTWSVETAAAGYSGTGYIEWGQGNYFNNPGNGLISVKIKINNTGVYRFQWRNKIGEGSSTTDENDSWVRFPDASLNYAAKGGENGTKIYPLGSGQSPNPNGSGSNNWWKVYSNTIAWNWATRTSDNDPHDIYVQFDSPGVYTMEISARSNFHFIDRIVLSKSSVSNPTNLNNPETPCTGSNNTVGATGVSVSPANAQILVGATTQLNASVSPSNATNTAVTWSSSNNATATVDNNGLVTGIAQGNVTITATTNDGNFTDTAAITVTTSSSCTDVNLSAINDFTNINIAGFAPGYIDNIRNALAIDASVYKDQFAAATTTFIGNSETYDIVLNTLTETDGESTYRIFIENVLIGTFQNPTTTTDYAPASQSFNNIAVTNGASIRIEFNSSTNGNIPEGNSTAYSRGRWTSLELKCAGGNTTTIPVVGVSVSPENAQILIGATTQLNASISPSNATNTTVTWSSSNNAIATVDNNGLVTGIAQGNVTITATTNDGNFTDTAAITVNPQNNTVGVTNITLSPQNAQILVGATTQLNASISPNNATNTAVTWSSSNNAIATVDNNGLVTGIAQGNVTITVTTNDGNFTDTATITVSENTSNNCSADYEEIDNLVVIEAENIDNKSTWSVETAAAGYSGTGYIEWGQGNYFNNPGNGLISVKIKINNTGVYRFQWRNKIGEGSSTTDENDSWVRFPDASLNYAAKGGENGTKIYPLGSGQSPNPNGSGSNNWWKVYSNTIAWNWATRTSDNDPHDIYVQFDSPGVYTMEISARSNFHFIDRIVLSKSSVSNPTNLNNPETPCTGSNNTVGATGVSVSPENAQILVGATTQLNASISPSNATNTAVTWSSSNNAIATVDNNGLVTGIAQGNVTITATTNDGNFTDTATITVNPQNNTVGVTNITVSPENAQILVGATTQLNASISPSNATNTAVTWSSSNNAIATVDNNGLVTGITQGNVTITATTNDGNFTDTATITVNPQNNTVGVTNITVSPENAQILVGATTQLNASISPSNATNTAVTWSSSNNAIATVDNNGLVTGIAQGNVTITATTNDGNFTDTATITVNPQNNTVGVTNITVSPENAQILVGATTQLNASISPSNATNTAVTWSSSNNAIATVDNNGLVTGITQGNVTITATTNDGNFTDTATITVNPQNNTVGVTNITVSPENAQILVGATTQLNASISPSNATNTAVTWSSSNNAIATVDNNGLVIADSIGIVTITVTSIDGNFSASVLVTVINDGSNEDIDNDLDVDFRIYPNPVNSSDTVYISGLNEDSYIVSLYDVLGKLLKKKNLKFENKTGELNISYLKSGMYFLTVGNDNSLYSTKLIIK